MSNLRASAKPWQQCQFVYPDIPTMISDEEKQYLYWLSSRVWTGEGHIVEMGPWLGGSTYCLVAGMRLNSSKTSRKLHVFDNFIWREFMSRRASISLAEGASFRPYFEENVNSYSDLIVSYQKSLPDEEIASDKEAVSKRQVDPSQSTLLTWAPKEPVEILFIDGAKSWSGLHFLLNEFAEHLIPGKSLLVCQDYKYWGMYWVPIILEMLQGHLELVHNLRFNTVTFRLTSPIDSDEIRSIDSLWNIDVDEGLAYLDRAGNRLLARGDKLGAAILQTCKVRFLGNREDWKGALDAFREAEAAWPFGKNDSNLERARRWLEDHLEEAVAPSLRRRLDTFVKLGWRASRRTKQKVMSTTKSVK